MAMTTQPADNLAGVAAEGPLVTAWRRLHRKPLLDYAVIVVCAGLLTAIGLVISYSTSTTLSIDPTAEDPTVWGKALKQTLFVILGLVVAWIALRIRLDTVRKLALPLLLVALATLVIVLIPGIGTGGEQVGSQSWIALGPVQFQPSELARVTLIIWGAHFLAGTARPGVRITREQMIFLGVAALVCVLIMAEGDMGMTATTFLSAATLMFFTGVSWSLILATLSSFAVFGFILIMFVSSGYRAQRFHVYFDALIGRITDTQGSGYQTYQGFLSLADGGATGVGLGQSRAKWYYLPESQNDFVFAIIGEELGLWGGALVIVLFLALGVYGIRAAIRSSKEFSALLASTLTAGIIFQAFFNVGYVIGLFPVTGIQLPLLSSGGTAMVITLGVIGLIASVARHEPEAISQIQYNGFPAFDRLIMLPEPDPDDGLLGAHARAGEPAGYPQRSHVRRPQPQPRDERRRVVRR
ncbi:MAG: putative peptidoglycan glycosyltransferase FtsW [Corynebacterium sp.]|nr:putative peptidoglycan glycosyltransferase FtsW [Corynebacterium sp.]